jgi:autotransporter translocation and assembly factor TamB
MSLLKTWLFFYWNLQIRGTVQQPVADGVAEFHKVSISSPVLPRPLSNLGGTIRVKNNQLCVEGLEGRVGRRGHLEVRGQLPIKANDSYTNGEAIDIKAESLEVRARHTFRFVG